MSEDNENFRNAGISPGQRLFRIEELLEKVDSKLDGKADLAYVAQIESRLRLIEIGGDAHTNELRGRMDRLENTTNSIQRKLAYATGTLAMIVVAVNAVSVYFINN